MPVMLFWLFVVKLFVVCLLFMVFIIGLDACGIIQEPVAVAFWKISVEETQNIHKPRNMLIFDHGGALTVSVVCVESGLFELRTTKYDKNLGTVNSRNQLTANN